MAAKSTGKNGPIQTFAIVEPLLCNVPRAAIRNQVQHFIVSNAPLRTILPFTECRPTAVSAAIPWCPMALQETGHRLETRLKSAWSRLLLGQNITLSITIETARKRTVMIPPLFKKSVTL